MENVAAIHVVPASGGEWTVQAHGLEAPSLHPTQGSAVAKAWEIVAARPVAEVFIHGPDGTVQSSLTIRRHGPASTDGEFLDEAEEDLLRRAAMRITPSRAKLDVLIERRPASTIDYSQEDDELPC